MIKAVFVGIFVAMIFLVAVWMMNPAGEGTNWPLVIFFPAVWLLMNLLELFVKFSPSTQKFYIATIALGAPLLYALYMAILARARERGRGRLFFSVMVFCHYCLALVGAILLLMVEGLERLERIARFTPTVLVAAGVVFLAAQAMLYIWVSVAAARKTPKSQPRA